MSQLSVQNKLDTALQLKEQGNNAVQQQDYTKALSYYTKAYAYFTGVDYSSNNNNSNSNNGLPLQFFTQQQQSRQSQINDQQRNIIHELEISISNNVSLCYIKLNKPDKAVQYANRVIKQQPNNIKALSRRSQAYLLLHNYSDAYDDAVKAQLEYKKHNNDNSDNYIQNMINQCKVEIKKQDEKLAQRFKNADFS